jgi:hypothetical protein
MAVKRTVSPIIR